MNKEMLREIVLYLLLIIMGIIIMVFPTFGLINPIYYVSVLFYLFAFFSIIVYFINRNDKQYEMLFLSLINIIVASYMFLLNDGKTSLVLGTGIIIFTFLFIVNKGYKVYEYKIKNNYNWLIEFVVGFLVTFLGILTIVNLLREMTVPTLMFGYYFVTLGIMCLFVPLFKLFVNSELFENIVKSIVIEEKPKQAKKRKTSKKHI